MEIPLENNSVIMEADNKENLPKRDFHFKKVLLYILYFFIFVIVVNFFFFSAPRGFPVGSIASISPGENLRNVSFKFKENNIIRSRIIFEAFVIMYGGEKHIISADYLLDEKLSVWQVARRISRGERHLAPVKVTIPEGYDNALIAEVFKARLSGFNVDNFLSEARSLEGYLFPDTYFFFTDDTEKEVIKAMNDNFKKKIAPLEPEISTSGKSERNIIIMASIVEREAKGDNDREYIAGILWKRITMGMPLQVDIAPVTYKERGLPGGPIGNPGIEAIEATIHPVSSNYLYYLHDKNGNIYYARTFAEHRQNILKYLK